jgi:RimJ/RimL family protein N-acetyltransferase
MLIPKVTATSLSLPSLASARLENEHVILRPPEPGDIDELYQAVLESVEEVRPWLAWYHDGYSIDDAARWVNDVPLAWREDRAYSFSIIDKATSQLFGTIGINQVDRFNRRANLGYFVRTSCTCRGTATESTRMMAAYGFEKLNLKRIEIVAAVGNYASQKVAMKVGATREGVARRRSHVDGAQLDTVMFSLVAEDMSAR